MALDKKKLLVSLAICFVAEGIGGLFTAQSVGTWYAALQKPGFTPPNSWFGPVWTVLYLMMGISLYLIWGTRDKEKQVDSALVLFAFQLILNVLWSATFFGMLSITGGLLIIIALWLAIVLTIYQFWKISRRASGLLFPYLAWVSYATLLNYVIWRLNP